MSHDTHARLRAPPRGGIAAGNAAGRIARSEAPRPWCELLARGDLDAALTLLDPEAATRVRVSSAATRRLELARILRGKGYAGRALALVDGLCRADDAEIAIEAVLERVLLELGCALGDGNACALLLGDASYRSSAEPRLRGLVSHARSRVEWHRGEHAQAEALILEARRLLEAAGDAPQLAGTLDTLGWFLEQRGEFERALACYDRALGVRARGAWHGSTASTFAAMSRVHLARTDPSNALASLRGLAERARSLCDQQGELAIRLAIGQVLSALARLPAARTELETVLAAARAADLPGEEMLAHAHLARVLHAQREPAAARAHLEPVPAYVDENPPAHAHILLAAGEFHLALGELGRANDAFTQARDLFARLRAHREESFARRGLAQVAARHGTEPPPADGTALAPPPTSDSSTTALFQTTFPGVLLPAKEPPPPPSRVGRYRVLARIGVGSFARVFKAVDVEGGEECVALKCLTLDTIDDALERQARVARFARECAILRRIEHPNVVRFIAAATEPVPHIAMEYVPGGDLKVHLAAGTPRTLADTLRVARGLLRGIGAIHAAGVVHRDMKPANVLLRENGEPVIADLGMGQAAELPQLTMHAMIIGTIAYMAPEQLRGTPVDGRADLYAIACILFQMLAGRLPFEGTNTAEVIRKICEEPAPPLAELAPELPVALARFVDTALRKDPAQRYADAAAALGALAGIEG